jgi:hypothetical protein
MNLDKLGSDLVAEFLGILNRQFYLTGPPKAFFWDRSLLIDAIQAPAVYLSDRGIKCEFPVERYREVLWTVIKGIMHHGDTANITHFGRYFLKAVQDHMRHQGDVYYEECTRARNLCADAKRMADTLTAGRKRPAFDPTVEILAQAAKIAAQKRIKKKAPAAPVPQLDLFACTPPAGAPQDVRRRRA